MKKFEISWRSTVTRVVEFYDMAAAKSYADDVAKSSADGCRVLSIYEGGMRPPPTADGDAPRLVYTQPETHIEKLTDGMRTHIDMLLPDPPSAV